MKPLILAALALGVACGQTKPKPKDFIEYSMCVEPIEAYGGHVRFSTEDHLALMLDLYRSHNKQEQPYWKWEEASRNLNWFSGPKPVSLKSVKDHMPRVMLLELRFPVDQNPHVDPVGLKALIDAEATYDKAATGAQDFQLSLLKKYNVGPGATYDQDMGGFTAMGGCNKYETKREDSK